MAHSEICPICKGKGTIVKDVGGGIGKEDLPCHGCAGLGWITVQDNHWPPTSPYPVNPWPPVYPQPHTPYPDLYRPTWTWTCSASNDTKEKEEV